MNDLISKLKHRFQAYIFSKKGNSKIILELFKSGVFDIGDEKLIDLYVESCKTGFDISNISPLIQLGVNEEVLLQNDKILKVITDKVIDDLNESNIHFNFAYLFPKILELLRENQYFQKEVSERVVLDSSKIDLEIVQTMLYSSIFDETKSMVEWLKELGYKPFSVNGFDLDIITHSEYMHSDDILESIKLLIKLDMLDEDWLKNADPKLLKLISSFRLPHFSFIYDGLVSKYEHKSSKFMELYMDENGFTKDFYKYVKKSIFLNSNPYHLFYNLSQYFDSLEDALTLVEFQYYNHVSKFGEINNLATIYFNMDKFFTAEGHTDELIKYLYKASYWRSLEVCKNIDPKEDFACLSEKERKSITNYFKIEDFDLKNLFQTYIIKHFDELSSDKIDFVEMVLKRLELSNSSEMFNFRISLANQLLALDDPIKQLDEIERVFLKNNIPAVGKIFSTFDILHPNCSGFNFSDSSTISPTLKKKSTRGKRTIIFSDLIRTSLGSNNRSFINYLNTLEDGNNLYESIVNGSIKYDELSENEKAGLHQFYFYIRTAYANTIFSKTNTFEESSDDIKNISILKKIISPNGTLNYDLADRVVSMFSHFAGFDTVSEVRTYMMSKVNATDARNRERSNSPMILEKGDFVKGIGGIRYLSAILQNGSVAKEFLGADAGSDRTPLDTDISMIDEYIGSIETTLNNTSAKSYGPIFFVLKNDDRFSITRDSKAEIIDNPNPSKLETFYTGALGEDHYGIRTGFASSEIDYILCQKHYDERIGLEIAMNGFYIPVVDINGKIVFTPDDYDKLREKMAGLSYYGLQEYNFSSLLVTDDVIDIADGLKENFEITASRRSVVYNAVSKALEKFGRPLKTAIDGDVSNGPIEFIDTGSTARGTNEVGGDFDFMMRFDAEVLKDKELLDNIKHEMLVEFGKEDAYTKGEVIGDGDFRLKGANVDGLNVDVDITFTRKTDKTLYSTDASLGDRLNTIKENYPEQYPYVVANIILAKRVLKSSGAYKPNRGDNPQGGLGGVGIENWVLQHGGSFEEAAISFLKASEGKNFEEFSKDYKIWDFGSNHLAEKKGIYPHDNFVNNMSKDGYEKMRNALRTYIEKRNITIGADYSKKR